MKVAALHQIRLTVNQLLRDLVKDRFIIFVTVLLYSPFMAGGVCIAPTGSIFIGSEVILNGVGVSKYED
jgi:hypothetical protein